MKKPTKQGSSKNSAKTPRKSDSTDRLDYTGKSTSRLETIDQIASYYGDPAKPESRAYVPVRMRIHADLDWLFTQAHEGNEDALTTLVIVGNHVARLVQSIASKHFELAKKVAAGRPAWPVNITSRNDFPDDLDELRKKLEIGNDTGVEVDLRRRQVRKTSTPCREIVKCILNIVGLSQRKRELTENVLRAARLTETFRAELGRGKFSPEFTTYLDAHPEWGNTDEQRRIAVTTVASATNVCLIDAKHALPEVDVWLLQSLSRLGSLLGIRKAENSTAIGDAMGSALEAASIIPPLTIATKEIWFATIKAFLLAMTGGHLLSNTILSSVGEHGREKYYRKLKTQGKSKAEIDAIKRSGSARDTENSDVEAAIISEMKGAFNALIPISAVEKKSAA